MIETHADLKPVRVPRGGAGTLPVRL